MTNNLEFPWNLETSTKKSSPLKTVNACFYSVERPKKMLMAEDNKVLHKVLDKVFFTPSPATEAAVSRCSSKQVFLNISQYSKEDTCAWVSF